MKANVSSSQINRARKRAGTPAISAHIRANGNPEPLTDRISESERRACLTCELETRQRRRAGLDISLKFIAQTPVINRDHITALQICCDVVHPIERSLIKCHA